MPRLHIDLTDLDTALQFRMTLSDPPRSRQGALSPGDLTARTTHFGAYLDGRLVGVCSIGPEPLPVLDHPDAWRLRGLMVLPDFRTHGVGPALLCHQLKDIETRPDPFAWSYVKPRLMPFFSHFGYGPTGYTYRHPIGGETLLFGNKHTLRLIREKTGTVRTNGTLPNLGEVAPGVLPHPKWSTQQ